MVIIGQKSFPSDQTSRMVEAFTGLEDLPEFISVNGPFLKSIMGEGIRSQSTFQCRPDRLNEAYQILNLRYIRYLDVPGYTYSLDIWMETGDLAGTAGL